MREGFEGLIRLGAGRKFLLVGIIVLALYLLMPIFDILMFTFLFIFLVDGVQNLLRQRIKFLAKVPAAFFAFFMYLLAASGLLAMLYFYLPALAGQMSFFHLLVQEFEEGTLLQHLGGPLSSVVDDSDVFYLLKDSSIYVFQTAATISAIVVEATLAIVLSLFFFAENRHLRAFSQRLERSLLGGAYEEICQYGKMFKNSFGKIIQTQVLIAFANTVITIVGLYFLGFPSLLALALLIFLLSMIPVAGAIVSGIPLFLIGLAVGGMQTGLLVILLIAVVHGIEAYYLNPRLLSNKTELPAFVVFLILIVAEHLLGIWGLIVGVPFFVFLLELFGEEAPGKQIDEPRAGVK